MSLPVKGALIGASFGLATLLADVLATLHEPQFISWWVATAIPAGGVAGASAARWVRPNQPNPVRAIAVSALVADLVGVALVSCGAALAEAQGPDWPNVP